MAISCESPGLFNTGRTAFKKNFLAAQIREIEKNEPLGHSQSWGQINSSIEHYYVFPIRFYLPLLPIQLLFAEQSPKHAAFSLMWQDSCFVNCPRL
ncbi:MAG TPA: hypothetical protein DD706_03740 [Nitrospiraceae bacterium]|nr:hypothetical protein [Nitrospiraceae bacterium]